MDENRWWIMRAMSMLAVVASVLSIVPLVSMSSDKGIVKDTYWTYGDVSEENTEIFLSIKTVVLQIGATETHPSTTVKYTWESDDCLDFGDNTDYCQDCEDACQTVIRTCIVNFITIWFTISTNYKRSDRGSDLNFSKFMAIFTGTLSSTVMLSALSTYSEKCYDNLPDNTHNGSPVDYRYGPGFICLLFPQVFKIIEVVFNIITPVPQKLSPILESLSEPLGPQSEVYSDF